MSDEEFLLLATTVAEEHLDDELALKFLEACESSDMNQCFSLAGRLVEKHAA